MLPLLDGVGVRISVGVDKQGAVDFNEHLNRHSLNHDVFYSDMLLVIDLQALEWKRAT